MTRLRLAAVALAVLASLAAGCAHDAGPPRNAAATPSGAPSGYPEMQQKADAAESALARADKDAAQDGTDR